MRTLKIASVAALMALAAADGATAAITGFRLPPSDSATPAQPEAEGPVAEDLPQSEPRAIEAPPAATRPPAPIRTTPAPVSTPVVQPLPTQAEAQSAPPARPAPSPTRQQAPAPAASPAPSQDANEAPLAEVPPASTTDMPAPPVQPPLPVAQPEPSDDDGGTVWPWGLALLALLIAGGGAWWWRGRNGRPSADEPPVIQRPTLRSASPEAAPPPPEAPSAPQAEPEPVPAPLATEAGPLRVSLTPGKLGVTLMNATLSYRLEIANSGAEPLTGLAISADMIAAHASLGREQQLDGPAADIVPQHRIERLEPGETQELSGEFRLPLSSIVPIRQGSAVLLLPLARFRLAADGADPRNHVFVVGQPGAQPDGALVPFRLDQGPRIYPHLAQRAFA